MRLEIQIKKKYFLFSCLAVLALLALFFFLEKNKTEGLNKETGGAAALSALADVFPQTGKNYSPLSKYSLPPPVISARSFLVGDLDTGEIILAKNEKARYPLASVTKLMTAYLTEALNKNDDTVTLSKTALEVEEPNGGLRLGEKMKMETLLYPLLLESSNAAAEALSESFGRGLFLGKMNQLAQELGLEQTYFKDPSGLSKENQSSVSDMFRLAGFIYKKAEDLFKISTLKKYSADGHSWRNNSQFLKDEGYLGGKSGYTDPALETVTALYHLELTKGGYRNIAIALLQSSNRYADVEAILNYLKKNVAYNGPAEAVSDWVALRPGSPDISWPDYLRLAFGGDIMLDRGVKASVQKNFGVNYLKLFENLSILKNSDIAFANLEGPISYQGTDQKYLNPFRMSPAVLPALQDSGLDVLSVANDHMNDWGLDAFLDTLQNLKRYGINYAGAGASKQEAEEPVVIEKYGMKIGFLAFSDKGPGSLAAGAKEPGILFASDPDLPKIIKNAAKQVDFLAVYFHFGSEYQKKHDPRQTELAHTAIDSGARLVVGSGPHVIEDTEIYKNGFIAYSLGNLIFDQAFSRDTMQGMILEVTVNRDGSFSVRKDKVQLDGQFQPGKVIQGKEEKI